MTDRSERSGGPRGRKQGPRRPGQGGRPPRPDAPPRGKREEERPSDRSADRRSAGPKGPRSTGRDDDRRSTGPKGPRSFDHGDDRRSAGPKGPRSTDRKDDRRSAGPKGPRSFDRSDDRRSAGPKGPRSADRSDDRRSAGPRDARSAGRDDDRRSAGPKGPRSSDRKNDRRSTGPKGPRKPERVDDSRPSTKPDGSPHSKRFGKRPPKTARPSRGEGGKPDDARSGERDGARPWAKKPYGRPSAGGRPRPFRSRTPQERHDPDGYVRLNRYLSNAGVASRRDADDLIKAGVVSVNGKIVTEMGTKVGPNDKVHYGGQRLSRESKRYVLLNKPKDFITTTDDPHDRRTVMALVEQACTERIYPVGRLDRHTTGLLLLTNDGDLAKKLTHPSFGAEKIYHVTLDKSVTKADLDKLTEGVHLDDGPAQADEARYVEGASKKEVGMKLHMGRNRIVRRMFEALGYEVVKLDRVAFAGLTKKELPRGNWRHLTEKEVLFLTKRK